VRLHICGVRGSTPAPGPDFVRYGGNTSCVALAHDGADAPTLALDAGTGLHNLSLVLAGRPFRGTILLGHLHWDHTHGLPFFSAGDRPDSQVTLLMPEQGDPLRVLTWAMSPPHFPIRPDELRGDWRFGSLEAGDYEIEGFSVTARDIPHKGGRAFGYRVSDSRSTIAYLSDHGPIAMGEGPDGLGAYHDDAIALADGADLLIHDAQYTLEEFAARAHFGHASIDYAVALAAKAGVRSLLLFHHDPRRTDDQLDAVCAHLPRDGTVVAAAEGMVIDLPR
jgi:phosphoribosyl 1,2-cyclic phosphodiesterase